MGKYFAIFKNSIQTNLAYRFSFVVDILSEFVNLGVIYYLWSSIYRLNGQIGDYDLRGLVMYYVFARLLTLFIAYGDISRMVGDEIVGGNLTNFIIKPLNYLARNLTLVVSRAAFKIIFVLPFFFLALYYFGNFLKSSLSNILVFILFIILALLINFFLFYAIGLMAFFLDSIMGISYIGWLAVSFLSGRALPLDILPSSMNWVGYLPFKYIAYVPIQVANGILFGPAAWSEFYIGLIWLVVLMLISKVLYSVGLKRYEGFGL